MFAVSIQWQLGNDSEDGNGGDGNDVSNLHLSEYISKVKNMKS